MKIDSEGQSEQWIQFRQTEHLPTRCILVFLRLNPNPLLYAAVFADF